MNLIAKIFCTVCVVTAVVIALKYLAQFFSWIVTGDKYSHGLQDVFEVTGNIGLLLCLPTEIVLMIVYFAAKAICLFWNFNLCWFGAF